MYNFLRIPDQPPKEIPSSERLSNQILIENFDNKKEKIGSKNELYEQLIRSRYAVEKKLPKKKYIIYRQRPQHPVMSAMKKENSTPRERTNLKVSFYPAPHPAPENPPNHSRGSQSQKEPIPKQNANLFRTSEIKIHKSSPELKNQLNSLTSDLSIAKSTMRLKESELFKPKKRYSEKMLERLEATKEAVKLENEKKMRIDRMMSPGKIYAYEILAQAAKKKKKNEDDLINQIRELYSVTGTQYSVHQIDHYHIKRPFSASFK